MSSKASLADNTANRPRYSEVTHEKASGATYTPPDFADFVAKQIVRDAVLPKRGKVRILDPAVGDGALLEALIKNLPETLYKRLEVFGYDTDEAAISAATSRLQREFPEVSISLVERDFLDHVLSHHREGDLFSTEEPKQSLFHLVIANPPYVRTQIMGAEQAQSLAQSFGLTGRVDLYYPFLLGISRVLEKDGVTGIITSNRFMTTKSGQAVRQQLLSRFHILHAWDLGDTKLFSAAVLPAVLIARNTDSPQHQSPDQISFSTIYETQDEPQADAISVLSSLEHGDDTTVAVPDGRRFKVRHGTLDNGQDPEGIWRVSTKSTDKWLSVVEENTWDTFRRIGKIRVGVKSTADKVFIRNDWAELPGGRPELLRPLITRHCARQFKACTPAKTKHLKEIIYPHEATSNGRKKAVDLNLYPKSASYLEQHRATLEARTYLIKAGRAWYELWVPQDPSAWQEPKIVFPDISEKPTFWMDVEGGIVNGECYWIKCENEGENDLLWLALAVANSTFIEFFYDHRFNNKLYAGRRRFITQYVEQFPLPDPALQDSKAIIELAKLIHSSIPSSAAKQQIAELDALVWNVFGLIPEKISR